MRQNKVQYLWIKDEGNMGSLSSTDFSYIKLIRKEKIIFGKWIFVINPQLQDVLKN